MENLNYDHENIERKYLKNMQKNQYLKVKNSLLELEKRFTELKYRELKNREAKIKREIVGLFLERIVLSLDDMDKPEEEKMNKIRSIKNTSHDWLINYIPENITKSVAGFKDKIVSVFKKNTTKQSLYGSEKK